MNNIKKKQILKGLVISNKMNKTLVVKSERIVKHNKYKKFIKYFSKFFVHDENNNSKPGDLIYFIETKPISKKKVWILYDIYKKKGDIDDSNAI